VHCADLPRWLFPYLSLHRPLYDSGDTGSQPLPALVRVLRDLSRADASEPARDGILGPTGDWAWPCPLRRSAIEWRPYRCLPSKEVCGFGPIAPRQWP